MKSRIIFAVTELLAVVAYASWSPDVSVATTKIGTVDIKDAKLTQAIGLRTLGGYVSPLIVKPATYGSWQPKQVPIFT